MEEMVVLVTHGGHRYLERWSIPRACEKRLEKAVLGKAILGNGKSVDVVKSGGLSEGVMRGNGKGIGAPPGYYQWGGKQPGRVGSESAVI